MNKNKKAFTLAEMLFVVVIIAMALTFSAYKIKNARERGVEKGATGFLMDLANAKESMRRDLAMQGYNLDQLLKSKNSANIQVTANGLVPPVSDRKLYQYLNDNNFSATALRNALGAYKYVDFSIPSIGEYTYYVYIGYDIPGSCGVLTEQANSNIKPVAYMCKSGHNGWVYLNNGLIQELNKETTEGL